MRSFEAQLQTYIDANRSEKLNRHNFLNHERIKHLGHMLDVLQILGVTHAESTLNQHMLAHALVNRYYPAPR